MFGIKFGEMDTLEFQELIPGLKPPAIPLLIPGLDKLPILPGWTVRDPAGAVLAEGARLPTIGKKEEAEAEVLGPGGGSAGSAYYPPTPPVETYYPPPPPVETYYPEQTILEETEGMVEPLIPTGTLADEDLELGNGDAVVDMVLSSELEDEALEL